MDMQTLRQFQTMSVATKTFVWTSQAMFVATTLEDTTKVLSQNMSFSKYLQNVLLCLNLTRS